MEEIIQNYSRLRLEQPLFSNTSSVANNVAFHPQRHHTHPQSDIDISRPEWYNHTKFALYVQGLYDKGVYANQYIPENTHLGYIDGEKKYIWEVSASKYDRYMIWVMEDCVIDCTETPRSILAMVREGYLDGSATNCELIIETCYTTGNIHISMHTTKDVFIGDELVYYHPGLLQYYQ